MKNRKKNNDKSASTFERRQVPRQLQFMSYYEEQVAFEGTNNVAQPEEVNSMPEVGTMGELFTAEERQNLKNAFRYICRLSFKESRSYSNHLRSLVLAHYGSLTASQLSQKLNIMAKDAETISGERYFKHYVQNMDQSDQVIVLEYMLWFLKNKYLRYIKHNSNQKGKRKAMKKELYIRFKNQVMMPHLAQMLAERTE